LSVLRERRALDINGILWKLLNGAITLGIMPFNGMTLNIMTISIMILAIMTITVTAVRMITLSLKNCNTQYILSLCWKTFMLYGFMANAVVLNVDAPLKLFLKKVFIKI